MDESFKTQEWMINTWGKPLVTLQMPSLGDMAEISIDVEIRVDASDKQLATGHGRRDAVYSMEWAIQLFAAGLKCV